MYPQMKQKLSETDAALADAQDEPSELRGENLMLKKALTTAQQL